MKKNIKEKIDRLKKLAKESPLEPTPNAKKSAITMEDSLAKIIITQKAADAFMTDLDSAIKLALVRKNWSFSWYHENDQRLSYP